MASCDCGFAQGLLYLHTCTHVQVSEPGMDMHGDMGLHLEAVAMASMGGPRRESLHHSQGLRGQWLGTCRGALSLKTPL